MRTTRFLAAAVLAAALGACVVTEEDRDDPAVVSANPEQVTIRFREGDLGDATSSAQNMCGTYQRTAQLRSVTPGQGMERIGVFACV